MSKDISKIKKRASFSIRLDVINSLNSISRIDVPNKSSLIESLVIKWLYKNNYVVSGSFN